MGHKFTPESATQIQRGTDIDNEIYAMVKFKELSKPVPFYAHKMAPEEQRKEMWVRFDAREFGDVTWPPSDYPRHPLTQEQLEVQFKEERNDLLLRSDWTQTSDAPISAEKKAEWAAYRAQLRDITKQPGFPYEFNWPKVPS